MTAGATKSTTGKSIWAVFAGFLFVFVSSLATDQLFHSLGVYPPWGEPMPDPKLLTLALSYRIVYGVVGAWITAWLAPQNPMKHVWIQAGIGQVLGILGIIPAVTQPEKFGPLWYPVVLALTVIPTAWVGGQLYLRRRADG